MMHEECIECLHGDKCPSANTEDGGCHGKWIFKSSLKTEKAEVLASNSTPLLSCPFCGSEDIGINMAEDMYGNIACGCKFCDAVGPFRMNEVGAKEAWNNRTT